MILINREIFGVAVNRGRGCIDYLFDTEIADCFEHLDSSDNVCLRIECRFADGLLNINLRRFMIDYFGCEILNRIAEFRTSDIDLIELCFGVKIRYISRREIIADGNLVPCTDKEIDDMRADKAATARYQYFHLKHR